MRRRLFTVRNIVWEAREIEFTRAWVVVCAQSKFLNGTNCRRKCNHMIMYARSVGENYNKLYKGKFNMSKKKFY